MSGATSGYIASNFNSRVGPFRLTAGVYLLAVSGTFNSGSVSLQLLGPDGSTYLTVGSAVTSAGTAQPLYCPDGQYQLAVSGSPSAMYASVSRIHMTGPG